MYVKHVWCIHGVCLCEQCDLGAQEFNVKTNIVLLVCVACVCVCVYVCFLSVRQVGSVGDLRGDAGAPAHALFIPPP